MHKNQAPDSKRAAAVVVVQRWMRRTALDEDATQSSKLPNRPLKT
jgi:hypothetical protein